MENNNVQAKELAGEIKNVPMLDLRNIESMEELQGISNFMNVGVILLSDTFQGTLSTIPMTNVGAILTFSKEKKIKVFSGAIKLHGDSLAQANDDEVLFLTGQITFTSPISKIGYQDVYIAGLIIAPKESEATLQSALTSLSGVVAYYHYNGQAPRLFMGNERLNKEYFSYLKQPVVMVVVGKVELEADVSVEIIQEKVSDIIVIGHLEVEDKKLLSLLLSLTEEKMGQIT